MKTIIKKIITDFCKETLLKSFIMRFYNFLNKFQENNGAPARI